MRKQRKKRAKARLAQDVLAHAADAAAGSAVAHAMGGTTLHAGGDLPVAGQQARKLTHTQMLTSLTPETST